LLSLIWVNFKYPDEVVKHTPKCKL